MARLNILLALLLVAVITVAADASPRRPGPRRLENRGRSSPGSKFRGSVPPVTQDERTALKDHTHDYHLASHTANFIKEANRKKTDPIPASEAGRKNAGPAPGSSDHKELLAVEAAKKDHRKAATEVLMGKKPGQQQQRRRRAVFFTREVGDEEAGGLRAVLALL
ncbi:hypothetical protein OC835_002207 [Tilletia horrida]|nr:hypothetical protein OC835_002207 [Tilletia horrida]